jgi:hypothetical protein
MTASNQFAELVDAAHRLQRSDLGRLAEDPKNLGLRELRLFVESNGRVLADAHQALQGTCHIVTKFEPDYWEVHLAGLQPLRDLARAFVLEAWLAWRESKRSEATHIAIDSLRLDAAVRNGGLVADFLIGMALAAPGISFLRQCRGGLDGETAIATARTILQIDDQQEALETIEERDARWEEATSHAHDDESGASTFEREIDDFSDFPDQETARAVRAAMKAYAAQPPEVHRQLRRQLEYRQAATVRLLAIELALNAYRGQQDHYPERLDALAPEVLPSLPTDPFTGQSFIYRRDADRYTVYSVGPDGRDDGGRFGSWPQICCAGGDLCLDHDDYLVHDDHFGQCNVPIRSSPRQRVLQHVQLAVRAVRQFAARLARLIRRGC